jgi:hypothetical protein
MIKYLKHAEIDKNKWDHCIKTAPNSAFCAYSWFLDIVAPQWEALVSIDYTLVMPLIPGKKWGIQYLYQPDFAQQLGIFSAQTLSIADTDAFLAAIPSVYSYIDIFVNEQNKPSLPKVKLSERFTQRILLNKDYDTIYKDYDTKLRRNLKISNKHALKIIDISPDALIEMFRKYQGDQIQSVTAASYKKLHTLLHFMQDKGQAYFLGVQDEKGELCATACFVKETHKITYFKGSSTPKGRELRAMHYLLNNEIERFAGANMAFDFGGSNIENISRFYKSFGALDYVYLHVKINRLPWPISLLKQ